jgi:hypothetical protein
MPHKALINCNDVLFSAAFAYANPNMKSTPFKDITNNQSEPNHPGN